MSFRKLLGATAFACLLCGGGIAGAASPPAAPGPDFPEMRVRRWQVGLMRPDRLQRTSFAFTSGLMIGLAFETPAAAAAGALTLGLAKEFWDGHRWRFDFVDLVADATGAAGAAGATITLTR
jgi:hypothetical protein